ncbi:sulfotransferase [Spirillospora sp. NPDC052269]
MRRIRPDGQLTVFIGGLHRSGTTLLASLLGTHPEISAFENTGAPMDEGEHLQTVCPTDEHHGGPGRFAFTEEAHMTEASPEVAERLAAQWSRYWDLSLPVLLEKSPPNMLRFRFLQQAFPHSKFILITRHPVPVSLSTRKWTPALSVRRLVEHWIHAHDLAMADSAFLDAFMTVRYEQLMKRPSETLAEISDFIGLAPSFDASSVDDAANDRYFEQWRSSPEGHDLHDLEDAVNGHGYSLAETGFRGVTRRGGPWDRRSAQDAGLAPA